MNKNIQGTWATWLLIGFILFLGRHVQPAIACGCPLYLKCEAALVYTAPSKSILLLFHNLWSSTESVYGTTILGSNQRLPDTLITTCGLESSETNSLGSLAMRLIAEYNDGYAQSVMDALILMSFTILPTKTLTV